MDTYTFTLLLGGAGLLAMAGAGAAHLGGGHGGGGTHHGTHHGGTHGAGHGHIHTMGARASGARGSRGHGSGTSGIRDALLALISPRVLFGLLLGFGATGVLLRPFVPNLLLPLVAVTGALVGEFAIMAPVWRFLLRFASRPAQTFDASVMSEARASSGFNADGEGLVAVEVDGQIVQCLGQLRPEDRALGIRVRAGDMLRVEAVDSARQRCTVSYVRHALAAEEV